MADRLLHRRAQPRLHAAAAPLRVGEAVVLARAVGVDLVSGDRLAAALVRIDAVIDVTSTPTIDPEQVRAFFATTTRQLQNGVRELAGPGPQDLVDVARGTPAA